MLHLNSTCTDYASLALAAQGQNQLHCLEISGKLISVAPDTSRRPSVGDAPGVGSKLSARAPSFVPTASSAPGQEFAPLSGSIDPCNLFCKNLCPSIDNSELFSLFKSFGHITSARVMRDDQGKSREFGFVSYSTPESATAAMRALDGQQVGTKAITIRVHEPKQVREQKLARIFSGSSSAGSAGGASSRGPSVSPSMSPRSPVSPSNSNSNKGYFTSIPMGNEQLSASTTATSVGAGAFDEIELSRMEPTERDDIIMTEFIKRARELPGRNDDDDVRTIVKGLVGLSLSEQIGALNDSKAFERHVREIKREEEQKEPAAADTPKPAAVDLPAEKKQAPVAAAATEGPAAQVNGASTVEPLPTPQTEKERLVQAVVKLMPTASPSSVEDIVELLVGLPKKERAMALFNGDYLKTKVDAAQAILQMNDDEDIGAAKSELAKEGASTDRVTAAAATKPAEPTASATSPAGGPTHTLASLARLPCLEIVSLARASPTSLPVAPVDQAVWSSTDAMMDRILSESREAERKQKLGDVLFKKIKGLGFKGAPKITIKLLDGEDLRSLAHVAESFPEVLREKVGVVQEELGLKK